MHEFWVSSRISQLERQHRDCVVRNDAGSRPALTRYFYQYLFPCTLSVHSLFLSIREKKTFMRKTSAKVPQKMYHSRLRLKSIILLLTNTDTTILFVCLYCREQMWLYGWILFVPIITYFGFLNKISLFFFVGIGSEVKICWLT